VAEPDDERILKRVDYPYCDHRRSVSFALGVSDNGNTMSITNNRVPNRSQSFVYDNLNRITTATTTATHATDPTDCWGESYQYDNQTTGGAWGNLTSIGVASSAYNGCTQESLSIIASGNNQINGNGYDAAGNMTTASGASYNYNAENQLTSTGSVNYTYDGDGRRVEKSSGTLYWYGAGSDPIAESNLAGSSMDEYVFFDGKRIARRKSTGEIDYYFADHLGTSRMVVSSTGTILDDSEFYPFGGERPAIPPTSGNTFKFTGKETDAESGLDFFGARHYGSSLGRFMSADPFNPILRIAKRADFDLFLLQPQNWNGYAYTWNNPLKLTDPTGESVYLIVYTQGNSNSDDKLKRAAQTQADAIRNSAGFDPNNDIVIVSGVTTKEDFQNALSDAEKTGVEMGGVAELDMYSHSGEREGPVFHDPNLKGPWNPNGADQYLNGLGSVPKIDNWTPNASANFYGCNTTNFAAGFASREGVTSSGTSGSSYFSSRPDRLAPDSGGRLYLIDTRFNHYVPDVINYTKPMEVHNP